MPQHITLAKATAVLSGVGVHSGEPCTAQVLPRDTGGIVFRQNGEELALSPNAVADTRNATTIASRNVRIGMVEHVLAALGASGITAATVEVTGPEVPIMSGASAEWMDALAAAGTSMLDETYTPIDLSTLGLDCEALGIEVASAEALTLTVVQQFNHPLLTADTFSAPVQADVFASSIANARTFAWEKDIEKLRAAGLIKGGSLGCAVVFGETDVVNDDGLRYPDEPLRHKWLDLLGDLQQVGTPLTGHLTVHNPSHTKNHQIVLAISECLNTG